MSKIPHQTPDNQHPDRRHATCPTWCTDGDTCPGDHHGKVWGTVATGGLPPIVDSIEPPAYNTVCVRPEHDEVDSLAPHVALFGSNRGEDWETPLTVAEARAVAQALLTAADTAEKTEGPTK
jgi:hypothetical protein